MNKVMQCFWGAALAVSLFACKEDVEDADVIVPSAQTLTFESEKGQQTVLVKSTAANWTVETEATWIFTEISDSKDKFAISVDGNPDFTVRSAVVTIRGGNCIYEIDVLQKGKELSLELTAESGVVYDLNTQYGVGVKTKQNWKARVEGNWLQIDKTEGTGNDVIKMTFSNNRAAVSRTAKVIVTAEDRTSRTFTLEQLETMPSDSYHDSLAVVALYHSLKGETWKNQRGWLTNTPIASWEGIMVENGRVVMVSVNENIGAEGRIAPEIKYLTYLRQFAVVYSEIGGEIPNEIGRCVNLMSFSIANDEVGLQGNVTGELPVIFCALRLLNGITVANNKMSGELPWEYTIGNAGDINVMYNQFSGELPVIWGKSVNFFGLNLASNQFTGTLPEEWMETPKLNYMDVSANKGLSGKIPEAYCRKIKTGGLDFYYAQTDLLPCD